MALNFSNTSLAYQLILQKIDGQNRILQTIPNDVTISLPNGVGGELVYNIPAGAVDSPLALAGGAALEAPVTDFVILWSDKAITYKVDNIAASPLRLRAGGMHMLDSSNIQGIFVSNPTAQNAQVLFFQARQTVIPAA